MMVTGDFGKDFFMERAVKHWNGLLREVVVSPPLEVFQKRMDMTVWCHGLVDKVVLGHGLDLINLKCLFQTT